MKKLIIWSVIIPAAACAGLIPLVGCKTSTAGSPTRSGFLSHYHNMEKVDETTWRYINADRLRIYKKFHLMPVAVLVETYKDVPVTAEQRQQASDYIRQSLTQALGDRYPIVNQSGIDVGEIRVALTSVFKKGLQTGYTLEGEVLDSYSAVQVAAVTRSEIGEAYVGNWWEGPSLRKQIDAWSMKVRLAFDQVNQ